MYLPKVAKAAPEMMANRSDRRLPNLLVTQAHHGGRLCDEVKTRGFHRDQDPIPGSSKRSDIFEGFSNRLQDKPCAEAGSIYATKPRARGRATHAAARESLKVMAIPS
jgi:hypothetical protein